MTVNREGMRGLSVGRHTVCRAHPQMAPEHLCHSVGLRLRERLHPGCLVLFSHSSRPKPCRGVLLSEALPSVLSIPGPSSCAWPAVRPNGSAL